jgi:hypothetical protein
LTFLKRIGVWCKYIVEKKRCGAAISKIPNWQKNTKAAKTCFLP